MPLVTIPKSLYPLVPNAPGVPPLLRNVATILDTITLGYLGLGDALNKLIGAEPVKWGVFDSRGQKIAPYESVNAIAFQVDSRVSDYPVEQGSFASYNKVQAPFEIVVTLTCGLSEVEQSQFQAAVEQARDSLDMFTVLTPTRTYRDVNFTGLAIQRSSREGANMIVAQLNGREIRQKASAAYSKPKNPAAFDVQSQGQVQIINDVTFDASGVV